MKKYLQNICLFLFFGITNFIALNVGTYINEKEFEKEAILVGYAYFDKHSEFRWKTLDVVVLEFIMKQNPVIPPDNTPKKQIKKEYSLSVSL